jgi:hypothetical protein
VTAIYSEGPDGWKLVTPQGFPNERALQELVAQAPDLLPLSGSPRVVVLGREVLIGTGYVDVLAIEATGEPVLIEVKLRNNAESRRAVVAQVLSYAAGLHGMTVDEFEQGVLAKCLAGQSLVDKVREAAQAEAVEPEEFRQTVHETLQSGGFRLVLVLDQAPPDLVALVGYLEAVSTQDLVIDLITVSSYEIAGQRVVVPQRVQPETVAPIEYSRLEAGAGSRAQSPGFTYGIEPFRERALAAPAEYRESLAKMVAWAERVDQAGLAELGTYFGKRGELVLLPRLLPERVGLTSLYCWPDGRPAIQLWRSVFERHAPHSIAAVAEAAGSDVGRGNMIAGGSDALLEALFEAYQEAGSVSR